MPTNPSLVSSTPAADAAGTVADGRLTALILLVAGAATLGTSFAALPVPLLVATAAAWSSAVVYAATSAHGRTGITVLCLIVKLATVLLVALLIVEPSAAIGPHTALYWVPLGLANMGSGLWFLRLIRAHG